MAERGPLRKPRRHRPHHPQPPPVPQRAELGHDLRARRRLRPGGERRHSRGHRAGRRGRPLQRRARHRDSGAGRGHVVPAPGGAVVGSRRQGRGGRQVRPRDGGLPGHVPPLAGDPQARDRDGAGRLHRGRSHARLGLRPDRGGRGRVLRRPGGADGDTGRGVLRASVGARAPVRQGSAVHRRPVHGRARLPGRHGEPGGAAGRARGRDVRAGGTRSRRCPRSAWPWPSAR